MTVKALEKLFLQLCRDYAQRSGALGFEDVKQKKLRTVSLTYRIVKLQLVYRGQEKVGLAPSTLYCRVFPDKNTPIWLHLPQLLPLMEIRDYRAVCFPYIESEARMNACFRALTDFLDELLPKLEALGNSGQDTELLKAFIRSQADWTDPEEMLKKGSFQQKNFLSLLDTLEFFQLSRHTTFGPWVEYLLGHQKTALKQYKKLKDLSDYEQGLCEFLASEEAGDFCPIRAECFAWKDMQSMTHGKEDFGTVLLCALVLYGMFAVAACLILGLMQLFSSLGTECWFGTPWYAGLLFAALPAFFGGIALRRKLIPLLFKNTAPSQLAFDDIVNNTKLVQVLSVGMAALTGAGCLALILMIGGPSVQLYEDRGVIHHSRFDRQYFTYDQVEALYHIQSRYNVYGERLEFDSYVIATEDGRLTDLYGNASAEETREKALPLFEAAGIEVVELDSDRDLPHDDVR